MPIPEIERGVGLTGIAIRGTPFERMTYTQSDAKDGTA